MTEREIFTVAVNQENPEERAAYLDAICGHDPALRERVESLLAEQARRWLVCDTSPLTTLFYSQELFGSADPELVALAERHYDRVLLCKPDFEFVQDGTRRDTAFREHGHRWYQAELAKRVGTTQSVISRLENADYKGRSLTMLQRIASALNHQIELRLIPAKSAGSGKRRPMA